MTREDMIKALARIEADYTEIWKGEEMEELKHEASLLDHVMTLETLSDEQLTEYYEAVFGEE